MFTAHEDSSNSKTRQNTAAISFFNDLAKLVSPHNCLIRRHYN
nr:MAG TPA_asm: hypothetical protein [Caudoviricetes sp.]